MIGPTHQPEPMSPAPAGRMRQELAGLDDRELLGMTGSLPRFSQRRITACELLVGRYRGLVWSCVQRYASDPEPTEDLMQVGYVGLVAAINNFDPAVGCSLGTYARSHINGEVKRYFRDKRWREQKVLLMRFYDGMTQDQIGQRLGISQMQVSRLLGHALRYLRPRLLGLDERAAAR